MFQTPFSFEGRIRRLEFGFSYIIYAVCYLFIYIMASSGGTMGIFGLAFIPLVWFLWAQGAKRCHDLGKSGFFQLIPFYIFWMWFEDSHYGENEYGYNPKDLGNDIDYSGESETFPSNNIDDLYDPNANSGQQIFTDKKDN